MTLLSIAAIIIGIIIIFDFLNGFKMSKSLINRGRLKADKATEAVRDPIADAHVALSDIKNKRAEMVNLRVKLLAEVNASKIKIGRFESEVSKYEELAKKAGQAKNADDVRLALQKKALAETNLRAEQSNFARFQTQEDQIEGKIKEFDVLLSEAEARQKTLVSELQIQQFNQQIAETLKGGGQVTSAMDQLQKDVDIAKAKAQAAGELSEEATSLETKYSSIGKISDEDVNKYL